MKTSALAAVLIVALILLRLGTVGSLIMQLIPTFVIGDTSL